MEGREGSGAGSAWSGWRGHGGVALEGPRRAPGLPAVGREARRVRRGRPAPGAAVSSCPERWNNGEAVGEGHWEEGARISRKGETKEPFADCHLHVTRSPRSFLSSPCPCSCRPRRVHCTHRCWDSALHSPLLGGGAAHEGCPNLRLRRGPGLGEGECGGKGRGGERLRSEETAETKGPRRPGRPQTPAWPFALPA